MQIRPFRPGEEATLFEVYYSAIHQVGRGLAELTSDVSRTAQGFYERFGFRVVERRMPMRRGVVIPNARMRLVLENA